MEFSHENLEKDLNRVLEHALNYAHRLTKDDVLNCNPPCVTEIIRQFLVVVPKLGKFSVEKDVFEVTNTLSRKTGQSGLYAFIPFDGDETWVSNVRDQHPDEYPLAFTEEDRIKIVIMFDPHLEDSDALKEKLTRRRDLVFQYVASVKEFVDEFNQRITKHVISALEKRRETIWKTYAALEATGLPTNETGLRQRQAKENERVLKMLSTVLAPQSVDKTTQAGQARIFIVHGHDDSTTLELKNYIQNKLRLGEPTILHEQPSLGRTIMEKFEHFAKETDLVFVLLTPDDKAASLQDPENEKIRARQNVIFEMGFFLGKLERKSGRVLLLHKGELEIPSDISGLVYIDISDGIEAAGEIIRGELEGLGILG